MARGELPVDSGAKLVWIGKAVLLAMARGTRTTAIVREPFVVKQDAAECSAGIGQEVIGRRVVERGYAGLCEVGGQVLNRVLHIAGQLLGQTRHLRRSSARGTSNGNDCRQN